MSGVDQYVHLCFTTDHPLAYLAQRYQRIDDLVWLFVNDSAAIFHINGVQYCPEVSNKSGAALYTIDYARKTFDDTALYGYVGDNGARRIAAEMCEILVPDHLPLEYFWWMEECYPSTGGCA